MKRIRMVSLLLTLCFLAVSVFTAYILYKSYKDKKSAKAATPEQASAAVVRASNDSNPYEDPNDPNTKEDGTCFSTGTMTGYFMEIKLSNVSGDMTGDIGGLTNGYSKKTSNVTAIITFTDIRYNGKPVFISVYTKIKATRTMFKWNTRFYMQEDFTEEKDNAIRLPASYYNYLKYCQANNGASIQRFNVMFLYNEGKRAAGIAGTKSCDVRLYTKDIPADSDDPASPNFKLDNWAGIMALATKAGCDSASCSNAWGTIKIVLIVIAVAFGVAIVIWLLRMFIGLLRGK